MDVQVNDMIESVKSMMKSDYYEKTRAIRRKRKQTASSVEP